MRFAIFISLLTSLSFAQPPRPMTPGASYIGVGMQEGSEGGVIITVVEPMSPAEKAGIKVGDVVLKFNGQKVDGYEQLASMVRETPPGRESKVEINRAGSTITLTVRVAQRKAIKVEPSDNMPMSGSWPFEVHLPEMPRTFVMLRSSSLGIEAESIDGQLAQYFGVKEGVLVRSVTKGSAAERAGIRAGDVLLKIEDTRVASATDVSLRLRTLRGKAASFNLMRDHKDVTVTVAVPEEDPAGRIEVTPFLIHPNQP